MPRKKGTPNATARVIEEIIAKHQNGATRKQLSAEYGIPFKTIKGMIWRENRKLGRQTEGLQPTKTRGRKPVVTLAEYKYENKRLKMENGLLRDFLSLVGRK